MFRSANDADFKRHLDNAAKDLGRVRPLVRAGSITVEAGTPTYAAPADLVRFKQTTWGLAERRQIRPWEPDWPGALPRVRVVSGNAGRELLLAPAPTQKQIRIFGSDFPFEYFAGHTIGANAADTTVHEDERAILLLRAQIEALKEMSVRNIGKPVNMRDGLNNQPRNGTPAALHLELMKQFEGMAS